MNKRMLKKAEKEKRRRAHSEFNVMKAYCAEGEFAFAVFGCIAFALLRLYMLYIEIADGGSVLLLAEGAACVLLAISMLFCSIFSRAERIPNGFTSFALFLILVSCAAFCAFDVISLFAERDILGMIQTASMILYAAGCGVAILALMWAGADKKISTSIGLLPASACVASMIFLVVRTLSVFPVLLSAIGPSYSWDAASDLSAQLSWALRSVSRTGGYAVSMFYARMLERVGLLFAVFSTMPLLFKFKPFFERGNRELDFKKEFAPIRLARIEKAVEREEDFEYMPKFASGSKHSYEKEEQHGEMSFEEDILEQEEALKPFRVGPRVEDDEQGPKAEQLPINAVETEISISDNEPYVFAKPESVVFERSKKEQISKPKRKDKPNYSDPEDPDFWNHYLD